MSEPGPVVSVRAGALRGTREGGTAAFLGVPYAAPPVGPARWAAPPPVAPWEGVRDATRSAPAPPQPVRPVSERFFGDLSDQDEDCLSLNLWAPVDDGPGRPVVVWVHGGGFTIGSAGSEVFDGAALSRALDAVVVTVGYRLGSLGWLCHPALAHADGGSAGNWGLQDVIAALAWVRDEAATFGGDPSRVVLAGESAGAAIVVQVLGAPSARGLVQRAVTMSPPLGESTHPAELGARWAEAIAVELGGAGAGFAAARDAAPEAVIAAHEALLTRPPFAGTRGGALAMLDPATIPADPLDLPTASLDVPVLVGTNADEATFFFRQPGRVLRPDPEALEALVAHQPGVDDVGETLRAYRAALGTDDPNELLVRIATDAIFVGPVARWSAARAAAGGSVHRYRLEHPSIQPGLGAVHSVGVPLLFGSYGTPTGGWLTGDGKAARAVSGALQRAVRGFVHAGDPGWARATGDPGVDAVFVFGAQTP